MLLENFHDLTFHACKGLIMGPLLEVDSATKTDVSGKTCFDSSVGGKELILQIVISKIKS